jgi:hypothetical protein
MLEDSIVISRPAWFPSNMLEDSIVVSFAAFETK